MNEELKKEIAKLRAEIERHNTLYYELANPLISDFEYDQLVQRLKELEARLGEGEAGESILDKVGNDLRPGAETIPHLQRMYSLDNTYSAGELQQWCGKLASDLGYFPALTAELKIDGLSINLYYEGGELQYATTRGDGITGEVVTANVRLLSGIPFRLEHPSPIEIRGEIYIPVADFLRLNEQRLANEEKAFANPRNAAAGSLKLKDPEEVKKRHLQAIFYSVGQHGELPASRQSELLAWLARLGFPTAGQYSVCASAAEVQEFCDRWESERYSLPFEIDGVVVKIDELALQKRLGFTAKSPKWAVAYKFEAEESTTTLLSVTWEPGRTGKITPLVNYPIPCGKHRLTFKNADLMIERNESVTLKPGQPFKKIFSLVENEL